MLTLVLLRRMSDVPCRTSVCGTFSMLVPHPQLALSGIDADAADVLSAFPHHRILTERPMYAVQTLLGVVTQLVTHLVPEHNSLLTNKQKQIIIRRVYNHFPLQVGEKNLKVSAIFIYGTGIKQVHYTSQFQKMNQPSLGR
jgi:hypothetical protein